MKCLYELNETDIKEILAAHFKTATADVTIKVDAVYAHKDLLEGQYVLTARVRKEN